MPEQNMDFNQVMQMVQSGSGAGNGMGMEKVFDSYGMQSMYPAFEQYIPMMGQASYISNVFSLLSFLLIGYGLYQINKKLGNENSWLSFIPVIQIYMYFKAGNNSFLSYLLYPILFLLISFVLAIPTFGLSVLIAILYLVYCIVKNLHSISKNTGHGALMTLGIIFFPYIVLPYIGYTMKDTQVELSGNGEGEDISQKEEIIEL
ncbi:hypothetical protein GW846_02575 [Candidatus Gracilibacteria bacterium]|nr:hypothetical protein [Candidatus Gracilibacteria bacterium]